MMHEKIPVERPGFFFGKRVPEIFPENFFYKISISTFELFMVG